MSRPNLQLVRSGEAPRVVRLEGYPGVRLAFEIIQARICANMAPRAARHLLSDISRELTRADQPPRQPVLTLHA